MPMLGKPVMGPNPKPMRTPAGMVFAWLVASIYIYNKICFESFVFNFFQTVLVVLWLTGGVPLSDPWQGMEILDRAADL